ncbi:hypothetical protein [Streptomyces sp. NPDC058240]|uniref:hypothetical protein n=1 Tax=Streptomyces sp. NPDC058240 TaxID=3346396 RepID=UPI0036E513C6
MQALPVTQQPDRSAPLERRPAGAARITDLSADPGRGSEDAEAEVGHAEVAPAA